VASGLPDGATYTVEETDAKGLKSTLQDATGTVADGKTATVTCTNTRPEEVPETGKLAIKKVVSSSTAADKQKTFKFKVTILDAKGKTDTSVDGKYGDITFKKGVATDVALKDGETKTATGLPINDKFEVVETDAGGLTPSYKQAKDTTGTTVTCTNTRPTTPPTTPTTKTTTTTTPTTGTTTTPKTGDETDAAAMAAALAAGTVLVATGWALRRRREAESE